MVLIVLSVLILITFILVVATGAEAIFDIALSVFVGAFGIVILTAGINGWENKTTIYKHPISNVSVYKTLTSETIYTFDDLTVHKRVIIVKGNSSPDVKLASGSPYLSKTCEYGDKKLIPWNVKTCSYILSTSNIN